MKITSFEVTHATKFNDPHENYRNHTVGTVLKVELEEGESLEDSTATVRGTRRGFGQQGWARSTEEEFVAWAALHFRQYPSLCQVSQQSSEREGEEPSI